MRLCWGDARWSYRTIVIPINGRAEFLLSHRWPEPQSARFLGFNNAESTVDAEREAKYLPTVKV